MRVKKESARQAGRALYSKTRAAGIAKGANTGGVTNAALEHSVTMKDFNARLDREGGATTRARCLHMSVGHGGKQGSC